MYHLLSDPTSSMMYDLHIRPPVKLTLNPFSTCGSTSLPSSTKLRQGNIFTGVCQSFYSRGGVCLSACWVCPLPRKTLPLPGSTPSPEAPPEAHPRPPPMVTAADGAHPTGMLSSLVCTQCQWSPGTINSTHTGTHLHTFAHMSLLYFFRMKTTTMTSMVEALKWKDNVRSVS